MFFGIISSYDKIAFKKWGQRLHQRLSVAYPFGFVEKKPIGRFFLILRRKKRTGKGNFLINLFATESTPSKEKRVKIKLKV